MDFVLINKIILALINLVGLFFAILGFFANRSQKANKFFFWSSIALLGVIDSAFFSFFAKQIFSNDSYLQLAFVFARASWVFVCLFFSIFYFFAIHFPRTGKDINAFHWMHSLIWMAWLVICFTELLISGTFETWDYQVMQMGGLQIICYFTMAFSVIYFSYVIFSKYNFLQEEDKGRSQYFFFATAISIVLFLILSVALPLFDQDYFSKTYIFGVYSLIIFEIIVSIALFQKTAIGAKAVLTQLMVLIVGSALLSCVIFAPEIWMKIIYGAILAFFGVFGMFLAQDASKETKQKMILQTQVQQRISELEDIKKRLEESKAVLEIRIQARTKALKDLADNLETQVQQRTQEMQNKVKELERANQLMVDRELAMSELKKENVQLKQQVQSQQGNGNA